MITTTFLDLAFITNLTQPVVPPIVIDTTYYYSDGTPYTLGPSDTFAGYTVGSSSIGINSGYGWASGWETRSLATPDIFYVVAYDDLSSYVSGSLVSGLNGGEGWSSSYY